MAQNLCPHCGQVLATADINISQGAALCRACGKLSPLADVLESAEAGPVSEALATTPAGCHIRELGHDIHIRATLRSLPTAAMMLGVALFWNGIVSVFVLGVIQAFYTHFFGPMPAWFPGLRNADMPLGMAIFMCLFLTPFVAIGLAMIVAMFMSLVGHVEVRLRGSEGLIRTGIGSLVFTRRFDAGRVRRVTIQETMRRTSNNHAPSTRREIHIEADRTVKFGSSLTEPRRKWLRAVLQVLLLEPKSTHRQVMAG